jgi:hypothetical protein
VSSFVEQNLRQSSCLPIAHRKSPRTAKLFDLLQHRAHLSYTSLERYIWWFQTAVLHELGNVAMSAILTDRQAEEL